MADEISISLNFSVTQGYFSRTLKSQFNDDFPITGVGGGIQKIGTTPEEIDFGDVTYEGWLHLENLDADNTIDWGPSSGATWLACHKLTPGMAILVYVKPGVTFKAAARNAESRLYVNCFDTCTGT